MKKKLLSIFIVIFILFSSTSCSFVKIEIEQGEEKENITDTQKENENPGNVENIPEEKEKENEEIPQKDSEEKGDFLFTASDGTRILHAVDDSNYYVFTRSFAGTGLEREYYGIIDIDGNEIVAPTYELLGWCGWHEVIYAEPFPEGTPDVIIDDDYKISLHYGHGAEGGGMYLYEKKTGKCFFVAGFGGLEFQELQSIPEMTPYYVYDAETPIEVGYYEPMLGEIPDYAKIEEALYNFGEGEYEFVSDRGDTVSLGVANYVNPFANGYYIVRRGDKWGYIDGLGNEASGFIYDDAAQATSDGRAWVEHEGLWKVLKLK